MTNERAITPAIPPMIATLPGEDVQADRLCMMCGYNLRGLSTMHRCPECGATIDSHLLQNSPRAYLEWLHTGLVAVLIAIIVQIALAAIDLILEFAFRNTPEFIAALTVIVSFVYLVLALVQLWGWWKLSSPDPTVPHLHAGETPRRVVRTTLGIQLVMAIVSLPVNLYAAVTYPNAQYPMSFLVLIGLVAIAALMVSAVQFFAAMLYIRWLAPRIPDAKVFKRAKTLMWLGPLLCTVGVLLLGLGPLIALVLYCSMLNWMRIDLKRLRKGDIRRADETA